MSESEGNKLKHKHHSNVLKIALFATGISGIVAEYILSTLASYFIGNAILQFTLIVSIMLFSMGLGSRFSKWFDKDIIAYFLITELVLSVLVSFGAVISYLMYGFTDKSWVVIYFLSILVGILIGLEIPFATRINEQFESLKTNISSILEKDYYGSLIGGLFFAFIGLPYLGLTYTPFVLGFLNFFVSLWMFITLKEYISKKWISFLNIGYFLIGGILVLGVITAKPIIKYGEQAKYKDKIVFEKQTKYQKIIITKWLNNHSLYINGNQQLSTFDEYLYHEPMVHPVMGMNPNHSNILVLGGGDGCLVRELLKYEDLGKITLVDLDEEMLNLGKSNTIFTEMNQNSLNNKKVTVVAEDAFTFIEASNELYDLIFIDLPDPNSVDINKLYTKEFYTMCKSKMTKDGILITQSGSPYYATKAFYCVGKTMKSAGFNTVPLHNQVLTLGEWGWWIGSQQNIHANQIKQIQLPDINLKWLNNESLNQITSFGKPLVDTSNTQVNTIISPVLYTYYKQGNWHLF